MLRLILPPNLAAAAARDAVAVRLEADDVAGAGPELLPALALLSAWLGGSAGTGKGPLRLVLQLDRAKLRLLIGALEGQPVFFAAGSPAAPMGWAEGRLAGVSEFLEEAASPSQASGDGGAAHESGRAVPAAPTSRSKTVYSGPPLLVDGSEHFLSFTLPGREHPTYAAALELAKGNGFLPEPSNGRWWLRDRHKTLTFLARYGDRLRNEFGARFTDNFGKQTARIRPAEVVCETAAAGDGFEVAVGLRAGTAQEAALREAVAGGRSYVETPEGIVLVDPDLVRRVDAAQRALGGSHGGGGSVRRIRIGAVRAAEAEGLLAELAPGFRPPEEWRRRTEALRNLSKLSPAPLAAELDGRLRLYQRLGTAWLWHLHTLGLGGILADEMGLGKTLQALALLSAARRREQGALPCLVVCPASLLENWRREAARFVPELRVFVHHGENRIGEAAAFPRWDLVITSYGTLARDRDLFARAEFGCVVGDEAQHVKNARSQNAAALRSLRAKSRFLLTGTPVENALDDLRSLFEFLLPGYVDRLPAGVRSDERAWFDSRLRAQGAPYLLRRTKRAVAPELPEKIEQVVWCEMSGAQAALYREIQERTERELIDLAAGGASEAGLRRAALTQLLRLRQVCCDPRLVEAGRSSAAASAKMDAWRELLAEAVDDGHRVLVFSQFTSLLALLREELDAQGTPYCYLDGSMPAAARQAAVDRFQGGEGVPLFLLSLKAGGSGLNLTAADTVIHYDPWWNPAAEAQATDRAHRIGQRRVVTSYKLVCTGTVEEKVLALQAGKRALLADIFEASDAAAARLSLADLRELIR